VRLVRDNFTANLLNYAGEVMRDHPEEYKAEVESAQHAGQPIYQHDKAELDKAVIARAQAEAEAKAEAETHPEAEAVAV
jgi:hypothetical protein